jgi:hypothetical protein
MHRATNAAQLFPLLGALLIATACGSTTNPVDDTPATLPAAYADFNSDNVTVVLSGSQVVIESNGYPDHTSPYWSPSHPLRVEVPAGGRVVPGYIDDFTGSYSLTVPASPARASASTATGLGPIGIARSGAMIYNDQEGPNRPIDDAIEGLDASGAHTGPQSYHYHLETAAWSVDDAALIGVIADGFFLYGRRDKDGTHPTDLDASGGHVGVTPHNPDGEYHYHIQNTPYLGGYYLLFTGDYRGTANAIR